ncbi:hypothetical protein BDK51DRAFT_29961 [Blyttiomyces helicus]|uniref:F-box domain-containing protein n=1 Tax=Blyttiomyces helicus TaxID=388810 RepID=A0A4P9WL55_9FUNG|nr:hypothetical protein BDK51DRAFT_29961 [Blyttiomyces helicus]|eukprot:RKO93122.1 hypothetical protein BDK51DRAFT_29961 [Blyttiomyces helicus]
MSTNPKNTAASKPQRDVLATTAARQPRSQKQHVLRLPDLLLPIMQNLRDSRLDDPKEVGVVTVGLYSNLCAASLVCREWEASAASQLWDHVVITTAETLRVFLACCRGSPRCGELAVLVRVLDIRIDYWAKVDGELLAQLKAFAPWLRGLRALSIQPPFCYDRDLPRPPVSLVASFLLACPALTVLETPDLETDEDEYDPAAVARSVARLRCLRIDHEEELWDCLFQALLVRSVGEPLAELSLPPYESSYTFVARRLPNLEHLTGRCNYYADGDTGFLHAVAGLAPPLRYIDWWYRCDDPHTCALIGLLRACRSITHICLFSHGLSATIFQELENYPPLVHFEYSSPFTTDSREACAEIQSFLRARGSHLELLSLEIPSFEDGDLLTCLTETTPRLRSLVLFDPFDERNKPRILNVDTVAVLAPLKTRCPDLRYVDFGPWFKRPGDGRNLLDDGARAFLAELGLEIFCHKRGKRGNGFPPTPFRCFIYGFIFAQFPEQYVSNTKTLTFKFQELKILRKKTVMAKLRESLV